LPRAEASGTQGYDAGMASQRSPLRVAPHGLLVLALMMTACAGLDDDDVRFVDSEPSDSPDGDALVAGDLACDEQALGSDELTTFLVAHHVVDGQLGEVCFGEEHPVVLDAWSKLAEITPSGQLGDLGLFGGFTSGEDGDEVSLAFVSTIDDDGTLFQMSVNIDESENDPDELLLTMAHEFSHVFTGVNTQVDRSSDADQNCQTYFNGEGCYEPDSLMLAWITEFWGDGLIDEIDPYAEPTADDGQDRCDVNPSFFGAYAASGPEEDFAESFSAYVFDLEPDNDAQQDKLDWIGEQPGLAEYRDRAVAAGYTSLQNNFDYCG
jgi:hypothetical protein